MATCAVTGQTVVSRNYVRFKPTNGEARFYALASPPAEPGGAYAGTQQTLAASLEAVAEDISRTGEDGVLSWNPTSVRSPDGRQEFRNLTMWTRAVKAGTPDEVRAQILAGGEVRITAPAEVPGHGVATVDLTVLAVPPFVGA